LQSATPSPPLQLFLRREGRQERKRERKKEEEEEGGRSEII